MYLSISRHTTRITERLLLTVAYSFYKSTKSQKVSKVTWATVLPQQCHDVMPPHHTTFYTIKSYWVLGLQINVIFKSWTFLYCKYCKSFLNHLRNYCNNLKCYILMISQKSSKYRNILDSGMLRRLDGLRLSQRAQSDATRRSNIGPSCCELITCRRCHRDQVQCGQHLNVETLEFNFYHWK